ncbi:hypothetical protein QE152_g22967 [Popillia japonica]|uniref:Uncharacterized protein n=1 Tax=Popillia japonica TaxID=7064 RepID=A0AAW1KH59_POPJA
MYVEERQKSRCIKKEEVKKQIGKGIKKMLKTTKSIQSLSQEDQEKETECIIGGEKFEENWAHEDCVYVDSSDIYYYCDVCKPKK